MASTTAFRRKYMHPFKEPARQDPYRSLEKPQGTPRCPVCRSVNFRGKWRSPQSIQAFKSSIPVTGELKCPACLQLQNRFALGVVEFHGNKWKEKRQLVMNTIRHTEEIVRSRNDQARILWSKDLKNVRKVYVSLPELARQMGRE